MNATTTTHNQVNLRPQDYEVSDYLDNNPFSGPFCMATLEERAAWRAGMAEALGADWQKVAYRCGHCGNCTVRWIAACRHIPTGDVVVFGSSCIARLGFKDEKQFQLARLQARDAANKVAIKAYLDREALLASNPELAAAVADTAHHNNFVADVVRKLATYGSLSERQIAAVIKSVTDTKQRKADAAAKPAEALAGPAPVGRATVRGAIVHTKEVDGTYGISTKCLIVLENGAKAWGTLPASAAKGDTLSFSADFSPKPGEHSFAFYKRPTKVNVLAKEAK